MNDADLDDRTNSRRADKGDRHRDDDAEWTGNDVKREIGEITAEHQHLAMRHVDDAHQAEAQCQSQGRQNEQRGETETVEDLTDEERELAHALPPPSAQRLAKPTSPEAGGSLRRCDRIRLAAQLATLAGEGDRVIRIGCDIAFRLPDDLELA